MATSDEDKKELKTMVVLARKGPINMAVCFGKKPENAVVLMDKKRKPDALGRQAKGAGETAKIGVGTLTVDGKEATFNCTDKPPSGLKKQLKLYFKSIDIKLDFAIIGVDGVAIVEDGDEESAGPEGGAPDIGGEADPLDDPVGTESAANPGSGTTESPTAEAAPAAADGAVSALLARIKAAKPHVEAADGDAGAELREGLVTATRSLQANDLAAAVLAMDKVEAGLARLAEPARADTAPDAAALVLAQKIQNLRAKAPELVGPIAEKVAQGIPMAVRLLRDNDIAKGTILVDALLKAAVPTTTTSTDQAQSGPISAEAAAIQTGIAPGTVKKRAFLATRWQKIPTELRIEVEKLRLAMNEDVPEEDPDLLTADIQSALDAFCAEMQAAIDDAINAGDPGYQKTVALLSEFRAKVKSHKLIGHLGVNPFDQNVNVGDVIIGALDEITKVLSA